MRFTAVTLNQGNLPNGSHFVSASMSIKNKTLDADCDIVPTKVLVATYDRSAIRTECDDHYYKRHIEEQCLTTYSDWELRNIIYIILGPRHLIDTLPSEFLFIICGTKVFVIIVWWERIASSYAILV